MTLTSCEAMGLLWFHLLLGYLTLSESCLSQHGELRGQVGSYIDIPCTAEGKCALLAWKYEWFSFKEKYHIRLNLREGPNKYSLNGSNLRISSLQVNDSGIYVCAVVSRGKLGPGMQYVGLGTTLIVTEKMRTVVSSICLLVVFCVLLVYSLAVVTLILKKCSCRKIHQINKYNSTKKIQFRNVLQEMHGKKFQGRSKENSSHLPQTEVDDIYQNVEERFEMAN